MPLTYPALADLDPVRFAALKALLTETIVEYNPDIDLRRGVVADLALFPRALLTASTEQAVDTALSSTSLTEIVADPAIADSAEVDRVLGNFRMTRQPAAKAEGRVTILLNRLITTIIPNGSTFTIGTQVFTTTSIQTGRTSAGAVVTSTDKLITAVSGGNFAFDIDVVAKIAGAAGNIRRGASAVPSATMFAFVRSYAATDFTGGADGESNASLVSRLTSGPAARAWSNRRTVEAATREQAAFFALVNMSIIGYGDAEMLRDQHSLWPVSGGGRADMYAKTAPLYVEEQITKTASLVSVAGTIGTWQFGLDREQAAGLYEVVSISLPTNATVFAVASDSRSADVAGDGLLPDIVDAVEAVYSSYQAVVIQFADTVTNAAAMTVGATASYSVTVRRLPLIDTLQTFWGSVANSPTSGDVLVKAPVPCFTTITATLVVPAGTVVDSTAVATSLADSINRLNFPGILAKSYVSQQLHNLVPSLSAISGYNFTGRIRKPDGTTVALSGSGDLTVPDLPADMTTARTVTFFVVPTDIALTISES
jgi:hypothetical protein